MTAPDIVTATAPVVQAFKELGVPHHICGSVASSLYGLPRATLDVDLVADLQAELVAAFVAKLKSDYYISGEAVRDAVQRRTSFNVIHLATMLKVDVFVLKSNDYDQVAFNRRRLDTLEDSRKADEFFVASAEDTILNKLQWFRMGGGVSERQWRDVIGVIKVQAEQLDLNYLQQWAESLGLGDLFAQALGEAKYPDTGG